jgi:uncharacterized protein
MSTAPQADTGQRQHYELVQVGYKLRFDFSADATTCTARYEPAEGGSALDEAALRQYMNQCGVVDGIHETSVQMLVWAAGEKKPLAGIVLAQATVMKTGENGRLELLVQDSLEGEGRSDDDTAGVVCFRNVQSFLNVSQGERFGVIHPPGQGVAGKTVQGQEIPPQPGVPFAVRLGPTVRLGEDGRSLYADAAGRIHHAKGELTIAEVYTVKGDVDFHVGNIAFNGFVEITGDVLDGFSVKASRGIKLHGIAGNAELASDGDIELCGMNGQGSGSIRCGGNLTVNFCNDTIITCEGNITAQVEMRSCQVRCMGWLRIIKGTFGGGSCIVLSGIEAGGLGTKTSMPTTVMVGMNFYDFDEIELLNSWLIDLNERFTATPNEQRNLAAFVAERNKLTEQMQTVRGRQYAATNPKINVHRVVYENVRLTLGQTFHLTREEIQGPASLISNSRKGGIRQLELSNLPVTAEQLEQSLLLEEAMHGEEE